MLVAMSAIENARAERDKRVMAESLNNQGLDVYGHVTDFALENQDGAKVTLDAMRGKIWVANFIFTSCAGICPTMSKNMYSVQESFADFPDVHLVSITVDPTTDTREELTRYAERFEANTDQWQFLRGEKEDILKLAREGMLIGSGDEPVNHSPRFVLVDREGNLRGFYIGTEPEEIDELIGDIQELLSE